MVRDHLEKNVYVIGAGFAGSMVAREIAQKGIFGTVRAFLDDDTNKIGSSNLETRSKVPHTGF